MTKVSESLERLKSAVRNALAPVPDSAIPEVQTYVLELTRGFAVLALVLTTSIPLMVVALSDEVLWWDLLLPGMVCLAHLALYRFTTSRFGAKNPTAGVLVLAFVSATAPLADGLVSSANHEPSRFLDITLAVPVVLSAFIPWRPRYSALLGLFCTIAHAWVSARVQGPVPMRFYSFIFGASYTCIAAGAVQLQRRMWKDIHVARSRLVASDRLAGIGGLLTELSQALQRPLAKATDGVSQLDSVVSELEGQVQVDHLDVKALRELAVQLETHLTLIQSNTSRTVQLLNAVREQTRGLNRVVHESFALDSVLDGAVLSLTHQVGGGLLDVDRDEVPGQLMVMGDAARFEQILKCLLTYAVDTTQPGQRLLLKVVHSVAGLRVTLHYQSAVVLAYTKACLTEPSPSGEKSERLPGLGLFIARHVAEAAFGGTLEAQQTAESGQVTTLALWLPTGSARSSSIEPFRPGRTADARSAPN
jgi:signal transduction histidine kinase